MISPLGLRPLLWSVVAAATVLACSVVDRLAPPVATPAPATTVSPSPAPSAEAPAPTTDPLPDMDRIHAQVSTVRGLYPTGSLNRELLAPDQIRQRVLDDFLADYTREEADDDARVLALLGLVEPGYDLWGLYVDLYEEQIAGYYDPEAKTMYVVGADWGGSERLTYAHEYVHALQDQVYDLRDGLDYSDEGCEVDSERCAAISALIEGDATLVEEQWWRTYATEQDWQELSEAIANYSGEVFDAAPAYLQDDFLFPYQQGLAFVEHLFRKGGWAAVDQAYRDPPTTTEQILHPELYGRESPVPIDLPDLAAALGGGWRELDRDVLGEWFTRLVLQQKIPEWEAADAAAGWGGDAYAALAHEDGRQALWLLTAWDRSRDAYEFTEAFQAYAELRFGERRTEQPDRSWSWSRGAVLLERSHDQTLWILAPDAETAAAARAAVEFPVR